MQWIKETKDEGNTFENPIQIDEARITGWKKTSIQNRRNKPGGVEAAAILIALCRRDENMLISIIKKPCDIVSEINSEKWPA